MLVYEIHDEKANFIPLSKAKLCGNIECSTIHMQSRCPICATEGFLYLAPILNKERVNYPKLAIKYRKCENCNAKYRSAIISYVDQEKVYLCPVCGNPLNEE